MTMRTLMKRVVLTIFIISLCWVFITSINFFFEVADDGMKLYFALGRGKNDDIIYNGKNEPELAENADILALKEMEKQRMEMTMEHDHLNASSRLDFPRLPDNLTESQIHDLIVELNRNQTILNLDTHELSGSDSASIVIVVQVHNRPEYLRHLVKSLRNATDIHRTLIIFSHDFYSNELNEIVKSIDFCPVMQIFYTYSMQIFPNVFPGEDPTDCPRDADREKAMALNCSNKDHPDSYGHYREARYSQIKLHWFWKINHVFDYLDVTKHFNGPFLFIEEDHFLVRDFVSILLMMYRLKMKAYPECNILTLGTYNKKPIFEAETARQVEILPFVSSKHNMGMSMDRKTWNEIKKCGEHFCSFDDYNWDWSLHDVGMSCVESKFKTMIMKSPRIFHIGECGLHAKGDNCSPSARVQSLEKLLEDNSNSLFPSKVYVEGLSNVSPKTHKPNGGWGDVRDRQLCIKFLSSESHLQ